MTSINFVSDLSQQKDEIAKIPGNVHGFLKKEFWRKMYAQPKSDVLW